MIEAILFDCDGVLVSTVDLHRDAFYCAVADVARGYAERMREAELNGLSTREKLRRLSATIGLPETLHDLIWARKQRLTEEMVREKVRPDPAKATLLPGLKQFGLKVACVSNSIRSSTDAMLSAAGLTGFDLVVSNEDVPRQKPAPDPYLYAMVRLGVRVENCLAFEDAPHGIESARRAGLQTVVVSDYKHVTFDAVVREIGNARRERVAL